MQAAHKTLKPNTQRKSIQQTNRFVNGILAVIELSRAVARQMSTKR
jgi:hypothetical protein